MDAGGSATVELLIDDGLGQAGEGRLPGLQLQVERAGAVDQPAQLDVDGSQVLERRPDVEAQCLRGLWGQPSPSTCRMRRLRCWRSRYPTSG